MCGKPAVCGWRGWSSVRLTVSSLVCTTRSYTGNHEHDGLCGVVTVRYVVVVPC